MTEAEQLSAFEGLRRYYEAAERHFRARLSVGVAGAPPPPYAPHQQLRLALPERYRERARLELDGRRSVTVMPGKYRVKLGTEYSILATPARSSAGASAAWVRPSRIPLNDENPDASRPVTT